MHRSGSAFAASLQVSFLRRRRSSRTAWSTSLTAALRIFLICPPLAPQQVQHAQPQGVRQGLQQRDVRKTGASFPFADCPVRHVEDLGQLRWVKFFSLRAAAISAPVFALSISITCAHSTSPGAGPQQTLRGAPVFHASAAGRSWRQPRRTAITRSMPPVSTCSGGAPGSRSAGRRRPPPPAPGGRPPARSASTRDRGSSVMPRPRPGAGQQAGGADALHHRCNTRSSVTLFRVPLPRSRSSRRSSASSASVRLSRPGRYPGAHTAARSSPHRAPPDSGARG